MSGDPSGGRVRHAPMWRRSPVPSPRHSRRIRSSPGSSRTSAARPDKLLRFFTLELESVVLPSGTAWMSPEASGACLELPPGKWRMPLQTQAIHAPQFVAVFGRSLPRALITITQMERRHLREPHFYVPYVGVAPEGQGAGLGTKLLGKTVERAEAAGLPTYLEATSERNAALYERLGFEHLGPFTVLGSPPLWPMRRA